MCTNSNFLAFNVLLVFKKLTFFCFSKMQLSHMSKSMDFNSASFPFDNSIFIPFSLMRPSLWCHRLVSALASTIAIVSFGLEVIYRVSIFFLQANNLTPFVTFQVPPTNNIACPSSSSCPTKIRFLLKSGICQTFSSNQTDPLGNNIWTSSISTTSKAPSAKYTLPKSLAT